MRIPLEEFESRFVPLVMGGGSFLKKSAEDQHLLLLSAFLRLEPGQDYSEAELNEALKPWSATFGAGFGLDHVTLRRHLIDAGYLLRDAAGTTYTLNTDNPPVHYDPAIADLDHEVMLQDELDERERRKRKYTQSS